MEAVGSFEGLADGVCGVEDFDFTLLADVEITECEHGVETIEAGTETGGVGRVPRRLGELAATLRALDAGFDALAVNEEFAAHATDIEDAERDDDDEPAFAPVVQEFDTDFDQEYVPEPSYDDDDYMEMTEESLAKMFANMLAHGLEVGWPIRPQGRGLYLCTRFRRWPKKKVCVHDKLPPPGMSLDARAKTFAQHSNRSPCGSKPRGV